MKKTIFLLVSILVSSVMAQSPDMLSFTPKKVFDRLQVDRAPLNTTCTLARGFADSRDHITFPVELYPQLKLDSTLTKITELGPWLITIPGLEFKVLRTLVLPKEEKILLQVQYLKYGYEDIYKEVFANHPKYYPFRLHGESVWLVFDSVKTLYTHDVDNLALFCE